jgi:hypothetical protein
LLRQTWTTDNFWWREAEKYFNGRKEYHARRRMFDLKLDKQRERLLRIAAARYLRNDPELRVSLTIDGNSTPLPIILDRLADCTGLQFTLANSLKQHAPRLGSVKLGNAPAYIVMELVGKHQIDNGRWVKIRGGYQLTGISKSPPPESQDVPTEVPVAEAAGAESLGSREVWLLACGVGLLALSLLFLRRHRVSARQSSGQNGA